MAAAVAQFYFRFRTGWRHCLQKVNVYQHTEYRQDNSIYRRDITISVLQKQTSAIVKFFFRFRLWPVHITVIRMKFCIKMPNFIYSRPPTAEIWRRIDFSRWRPQQQNATSGFLLVDAAVFGRSKSTSKPNFVDISQFSIHGWDITTSVFEKQTSAILEFYFRFRCRPFRRNWHVILHQATEFRPNRSTHCRNMTSYPFLKMAAAAA